MIIGHPYYWYPLEVLAIYLLQLLRVIGNHLQQRYQQPLPQRLVISIVVVVVVDCVIGNVNIISS
jgi:hypothetical protein